MNLKLSESRHHYNNWIVKNRWLKRIDARWKCKFFKHSCSSSANLCANADRENVLAGDKKFEDEED